MKETAEQINQNQTDKVEIHDYVYVTIPEHCTKCRQQIRQELIEEIEKEFVLGHPKIQEAVIIYEDKWQQFKKGVK